MNIQEEITEQQAKLNTLRALLKKNLSQWTAEETSNFENKLTLDIEIVAVQLLIIELYLKKPLTDWTVEEKE